MIMYPPIIFNLKPYFNINFIFLSDILIVYKQIILINFSVFISTNF